MTILTHILAIAAGAVAGHIWARIGEQDRWAPVILGAFRKGKARGYEQAIKEGRVK
jgi:hypothetical protein